MSAIPVNPTGISHCHTVMYLIDMKGICGFKSLSLWQISGIFRGDEYVRYPDGSSCGKRSLTILITTPASR